MPEVPHRDPLLPTRFLMIPNTPLGVSSIFTPPLQNWVSYEVSANFNCIWESEEIAQSLDEMYSRLPAFPLSLSVKISSHGLKFLLQCRNWDLIWCYQSGIEGLKRLKKSFRATIFWNGSVSLLGISGLRLTFDGVGVLCVSDKGIWFIIIMFLLPCKYPL